MYTFPLIFVLPFAIFVPEDSLPKVEPKCTRAKGMDTSPPQESIAILIRNESDMNTIKAVFGDVLAVTLNDPRSMKDLLLQQSTLVRSCFIAVESTKLLIKSSSEVYLTHLCRALYGDAILMYCFGAPIWPLEINKNIWSSLFL